MLSTNLGNGVLAVDLGKTGCRLVHVADHADDDAVRTGRAPGVVGLAGVGGVAQVVDAVEAAARDAGLGESDRVQAIAVGLVGYHAAAHLRDELAHRLARRWGGLVVLASDVTTTHVGAFDGGPGAVLAAGTGAVALAVDAAGRTSVHDGWGFLLGDDGSGYAVGRAGLRAALLHAEGRGGSAQLAERARERFGELVSLPAVVHGTEHSSSLIASFAKDVAAAAAAGDGCSQQIWREAGQALAATAVACRDSVDGTLPICLAGGLADVGDMLTQPFTDAVGGDVRTPAGSSLDGALRLARMATTGGVPEHLADLVLTLEPQRETGGGSEVGAPGLSALLTESARPDLADLDRWRTEDILRELWHAEAQVPAALDRVAPAVAVAVDEVAARLRAGGRMFYVGAGTPGRLAFVDASELPPTFGTDPDLVQALTAGGPDAVLQAREGAEDDGDAGARAVVDAEVGERDVVVGLTASGRTPFVVDALTEARRRGALTISMAGNERAEVSEVSEHAIEVLTGPEVISGSTRLKAGTAQKLFLNGLSTATMIRLGKTFGPYMVDMLATNHKLRERAVRMVTQVTGAERHVAEEALGQAQWSTRTAIVMVLRDEDAESARARLAAVGGSVRDALEETTS